MCRTPAIIITVPREYFKALQFLAKYDPVKGTVNYFKVKILVSLNNCIAVAK